MSADNYWYIDKNNAFDQPYAVAMGFHSDEVYPKTNTGKEPRFYTLASAIRWCNEHMIDEMGMPTVEYGIRVSKQAQYDD